MLWVYFLHEARNLALLFTFMPLSFLILNSNFIQSIIISISVVIIQLGICYYAIYIKGQSGSFIEVILYVIWFLPSSLFIAYTSGIFYGKKSQLINAKRIAEKTSQSLWGEMALAKKIQTILLPKNPNIPGYKIAHYMNPTDEVGGDYYDIINSNEIDWITIGDVSGHGVPAGLIMMMVQYSIRSQVMDKPMIKPSELLKIVNRSIQYNINNMNENKFMTITAFSISKNDTMLFSGKHEDIIYYNSREDKIDTIKTEGILVSRWEFKKSDTNLERQIRTGDIFLLYTDGLTESWEKGNPATERINHMFCVERLKKILHDNCRKEPEEVKDIILSELNNFNIDDDITFLIVKKN
jgi:serine phosphatase RsbU (regulator of sigma subunit)